jgi:PAS domain S-box-containing protein
MAHPEHSERLPIEQRVRLLEQVVVQANEAVVITEAEPIDLPGPRIVYVNDAFTRLTGYSADDVIGRTPRLFQSPGTDRATLDEIRRCLTSWAPFRGQLLNRHKDGTLAWIDLSIVPVANDAGWYTHWVAIQRDVTPARRNADALAQSEARLRLSLRAARMGTFEIDPGTLAVTWSDEVYDLFNRDRALGPIPFDAADGPGAQEDVGRFRETVRQLVRDQSEGPVTLKIRLEPVDRPELTYEVTVSGLMRTDGTLERIVGTVRDITDLVSAEHHAITAASRLRGAQRLAGMGVWEVEVLSRTVTWSSEMFGIYGHPESRGTPTIDAYFRDFVFEEDSAQIQQAFREVVVTQRNMEIEHRIRRADGSSGHVLSIAEAVSASDGRVSRVVGVTLDVSERRRAEARIEATNATLAAAQHLIGVGAWTYDAVDDRVRWSPEMFTLYGRSVEQPPMSVEDAVRNIVIDDRQRIIDGLRATLEQATPFATEYRFTRGDGEERLASAFGQAVRDSLGRVVAVTGAVIDVTDDRRREQRLIELKDAAESAAQARSQFLAKVSHELRTPMNGVLGTLELLRETGLDDDQRQLARMAHESAESLLRLLNDLLDFAKFEAGQLELRNAPYSIAQTIRSVLDLLEARAQAKGITLSSVIGAGIPMLLQGDQGRLRQVLLNLVGNAIKFTEQGSVAIAVDRRTSHSGEQLIVEVTDTGIGIPPARRGSLFTPFSQVHDPASVAEVGAGLGLSICRELVEQMGGEIGVDGNPGAGSRFWFAVPLRDAGTGAVAARSGAYRLANTPVAPLRGVRVLIAEDHPINRMVAQRHIESLGGTTELAFDGAQAVEASRQRAFDVILMDWQMPVMDGLSAARQIREDERRTGRPRIPIIAVTANVYETDRRATRAAGMDGFVAKPIVRQELATVLTRVLKPDREGDDASPSFEIFPTTSITPSVSASPLPSSPDHPLALLRRFVHDLANAVQAQDLAWFHRGARQAAEEAAARGAPAVEAAARELLTMRPETDDDWDDVVVAVRQVQAAMRALKEHYG